MAESGGRNRKKSSSPTSFNEKAERFIKDLNEFRKSKPSCSGSTLRQLTIITQNINKVMDTFLVDDSNEEDTPSLTPTSSDSQSDGESAHVTVLTDDSRQSSEGSPDEDPVESVVKGLNIQSNSNRIKPITFVAKGKKAGPTKTTTSNNQSQQNGFPTTIVNNSKYPMEHRLPDSYAMHLESFHKNSQSLYNNVPGMVESRQPPMPSQMAFPQNFVLRPHVRIPGPPIPITPFMPPNNCGWGQPNQAQTPTGNHVQTANPLKQQPPPNQHQSNAGAVPSRVITMAPQQRMNKQPRFVPKQKPSNVPSAYRDLPEEVYNFVNRANANDLKQMVRVGETVIANTSSLQARSIVCLTRVIQSAYPNARLYSFGSRVTGLGNLKSDLDIFVDIDDVYNTANKRSKEEIIELFDNICGALQSAYPKEQSSIEYCIQARTPIIKFQHKSLPKIDFSFTNGLGHSNSRLLKYFLDLQPGVLKTTLFVKRWIDATRLSKGGFNTYIGTLMVIFYFQTKKLLPSVASLQKDIEPENIGEWQANFSAKTLAELGIESCLDNDICGFFEYYSTFNFEQFAICTLTGSFVRKTIFESLDDLPPIFKRLQNYLNEVYQTEYEKHDSFIFESPACIQDPFDLAHNVGRRIKTATVTRFKHWSKLSHDLLKANNTI